MTFPDDSMEFDRCWSSKAGEAAGLRAALHVLNDRAAKAFIRRRDDDAGALRNAAAAVQALLETAEAAVRAFIAEGDRRRHESKVPGQKIYGYTPTVKAEAPQ